MKIPPEKMYASIERELGSLDWNPFKDVYKMNLENVDGILFPNDYSSVLGRMMPFRSYIRCVTDENMERELMEIIESKDYLESEYQRKILYKYDDAFFPISLSRADDDSWGACYTYMGGYMVNPFYHIQRTEHIYPEKDKWYEISILNKDQVLHIWDDMPHRDPRIVFHM